MSQLITAEELGRFAPQSPKTLRAALARELSKEMPKRGIDKPLIIQHFLAHLAHESGEWTIKRENMRYGVAQMMKIFGVGRHSARITAAEAEKLAGNARALANRVYGVGNPKKAKELGNTQPNDGYDFRGGGDIQTTGRGAFTWVSRQIGVDLTKNPDLIGEMPYRVQAACAEWTRLRRNGKSASEWALEDNITKSTQAVNGGLNGFDDRVSKLAKAKKVWPAKVLEERLSGDPVIDEVEDEIELDGATAGGSSASALVYEIQSKLKALGYRVGMVDGLFGAETRNAILAFEADNNLPLTGEATAALLEPLVSADMKPVSEMRQALTLADMGDSRIVQKASAVGLKAKIMQKLGLGGGVGVGVIGGLGEEVDLDRFSSLTSQFKHLISTIGPYWWVIAIAAGVGLYFWSKQLSNDAEEVKLARLDDERMGKTL